VSKTGIIQKILSLCVLLSLTLFSVISPVVTLADQKTAAAAPAIADTSTVDRLAGIDRYETAVKIAQKGWKNTSEYAVLAAGMDYNLVDALAAIPLAKLKNAPLLLTEGDNLNTYTEAELKRLEVKTVYVVSGEAVITKRVLNRLADMGIKVISLGGVDRFETAVNIAHELGNPTKIVVATAWNNADALSIAPIAANQGMPILLSDVDKLPDCVSSYINGIKENLDKSYVIGGQAVLSDSIKNALPNSVRVSGVDRYGTNLEILKTFANILSYKNTYIANGEDRHLVDSLAGGPLAAITSSPILLVSQQMTNSMRDFAKLNLSPTIIALGGHAALSDDIINQLASADIISEVDYVEGSKDVNKPKELTDNLKIIANNVVVENVSTRYSISIQGDNTTLKNVTVKGTIFVDPGEKGTATLENVTAGKIVVLSGATESIHLQDVSAEILQIASSNNVRIEASGLTNIGYTFVSSSAVLDVTGGSLGRVEIANILNAPLFTIELRGTFNQSVLVSSGATVRAGTSANISLLEIAPENSKQIVTLEGSFNKVEVNTLATINLSANALLRELITNAKADIDAVSGARVIIYDNKGNEVIITGIGALDLFDTTPASSNGGNSGRTTSDSSGNPGNTPPNSSKPPTDTTSSSISLSFTPTDQLIDPTRPVVYLVDKPDNKVYAVNYETKQISSLTFDLPPERLAFENNELYVTLLKGNHQYYTTAPLSGAIAIINTDTFKLADRFDIDTDPFDLVVRNGYIYVIPGSNQWVPISSYSRTTKLKVADSSKDIRFQSFAELDPVSDKIFTVDTDVSPRDMSVINISNGNVSSLVASPYHGQYSMATNFGISADGKYIFNGSGEVFDANLNHVTSLNKTFSDIAFNPVNNNFYTADKLNNTVTAYTYDSSNIFKAIATYPTNGPVSHLFFQNDRLITVSGNSIDYIQLPPTLTSLNPQVTINGPGSLTVPAAYTTSADYSAMVKDESGKILNNYFANWSLQSPVTGVSLSTTNGSITLLTVDSSTTASAITLCATVGNVTTTQAIQLTPLNPQVTINGASWLSVPADVNTTSSNFSATVKDQFGNTINDYPVNWSLQAPATGVSLSMTNGSSTLLTVDGTTTVSSVTLVASVANVTTTQTIQLTPLVSLGFTPTDQLINPTKPVIYLVDKPNNKVYAVNCETKQISSLTFDLPPERLAYENNELYVTLLKGDHQYYTSTSLSGAIAIINTNNTFALADRFDIDTDPFDLVVRNGYIYVLPGSNQWGPVSTYSRTLKTKVSSNLNIPYKSFAELNPLSDKIVTVDTDSSPRCMSIINFNSGTGIVSSPVGSSNSGQYPMATNFGISADGRYIFNGSGEVFDTNLNHVTSLNKSFSDIAFNPVNNNFYTADTLNNTITAYAYDNLNFFQPIATYRTNGPVSRLFFQNDHLIAESGNNIIQIPLS
jgi:putative cell wall-binding protein